MNDIIWGTATKIISTKSFEMNVTHQKEGNALTYSEKEIIEFTETDIMSIPIDENSRTVAQIEQGIKDKFIKCEISSRNDKNHLICKVSHSGAGGY
tara:strand:- start:475 stop:762 length:288 start_codon:yes stop_codon:yes gene_type:complete